MTSIITNTSVRLTWMLGFDGNSARTGGTVSYAAVSNGMGSGQSPFTGEAVTEYTINDLQPFTNYSFNVTVNNLVGSSTGVTIQATTVSNSKEIFCRFKIFYFSLLVPSTPTLNSVVPVNSTALTVTWTVCTHTHTCTLTTPTGTSHRYYLCIILMIQILSKLIVLSHTTCIYTHTLSDL